jgi:hypothetical protein
MAWNHLDAKYATKSRISHRSSSDTPIVCVEAKEGRCSAALVPFDSYEPHLFRIEFPRISPYDNDADEFVRLNSRERTGGAER